MTWAKYRENPPQIHLLLQPLSSNSPAAVHAVCSYTFPPLLENRCTNFCYLRVNNTLVLTLSWAYKAERQTKAFANIHRPLTLAEGSHLIAFVTPEPQDTFCILFSAVCPLRSAADRQPWPHCETRECVTGQVIGTSYLEVKKNKSCVSWLRARSLPQSSFSFLGYGKIEEGERHGQKP